MRIILLSFVLCNSIALQAQQPDSIKNTVDTVLSVCERTSYYSKNVDWLKLRDEVRAKAANARTFPELDSAFYHLLASLGDFHGAIYYKGGGVEYRIPSQRTKYATQDSVRSRMRKFEYGLSARLLDDRYGYIRIPSVGGVNAEAINRAAKIIHDTICKIDVSRAKGWIIDLRFNSGGNIYAMAAGMSGFLKNIEQVKFINGHGELAYSFKMEGMNLSSGGFKPTAFTESCYSISPTLPIVVLVSRHTASSGEFLASLLAENKQVVLVGEQTGGFSTSTNYVSHPYKVATNITTAYPVDKAGKTFSFITPSIELQPDFNPDDILNDSYMRKAKELVDVRIRGGF